MERPILKTYRSALLFSCEAGTNLEANQIWSDKSTSGRQTRRLAGRDSHDTERTFLVKFTRWVGEGMIGGGEGMRHSNALLTVGV